MTQLQRIILWVAWVAQSVRRLTLDLSSGLDLRAVSSSPVLHSALGVKPTLIFFFFFDRVCLKHQVKESMI